MNDNNTIGIKNMIFSILTSSNYSARDKFILIVAYALAAMFAIVIHEYSHARVAVKCGDLTPKLAGRLTLNPMAHFDVFGLVLFFLIGFGWAKPVPINPDNFGHKKRDTIFTSLAGIFANLLTAAVFLGVLCLINLIPEDAVYAPVSTNDLSSVNSERKPNADFLASSSFDRFSLSLLMVSILPPETISSL